jgi:hypothetical protein
MSTGHVSSPTLGAPRAMRLLCRRGLPDLPELIEADEEEVITADNASMNTYSTRHSASTSASSLQSPANPAVSTATNSQFQSSHSGSQLRMQPMLEIFTQTPPGSGSQLQTPFQYVPSTFRFNTREPDESSPPPSPSPREDPLVYTGHEYGLGVNFDERGRFDEEGSGMVEEGYYQKEVESGYDNCILEGCPDCAGRHTPQHYAHHQSSSSGEVNPSEAGDYMSPPSSPGTDCTSPSRL